MKSNSTSRVGDALAILKESAAEIVIVEKPKRKVVKKIEKVGEVKKKPRN